MQNSAHPKVVHLVPALFGPEGAFGGAERYALELARHMASRTPTTLVTFGRAASRRSDGALKIVVLGPARYVRGQRFNPHARGLFGAVLGADVVHCHQQHVLASSLAALAARLARRRVFVTNLGGGGWDVSAYLSTDRWYHAHLHISEYSREVFGPPDRARSHVIYGGVDTDVFSPAPERGRDGTTCFVGRVLPHKGLADLIEAVGSDIPLDIIGPQPDASYGAQLSARAAGKPIRFLGEVDDRVLVERYRTAACVVLPSVYRNELGGSTRIPELLGQTLLEAMACETPVVCTNVASMPEIVEDGVSGFVVPPNDPLALREKLVWLREHPEEARRMGSAGRRRVLERFNWDQVVSRCLQIYTA